MGLTRRGVLLGLAASPALSVRARAEADFASWLRELRAEALAKGLRPAVVDAALGGIAPLPRVIELDRRQPETRLGFVEYRSRVLAGDRVARGREELLRHAELLGRVSRDFGVPPRVIVALWGIETSYGRITGGFPVVAALATLAHEGRRAAFFRSELLAALAILDAGHIRHDRMIGSWAGAMGQPQFMPSSFHAHAIDYDGDGRRDIWTSLPDVFASVANYLSRSGWNAGYTWGREVRVPSGLDGAVAGLETGRPLAGWQALGVRTVAGGPLPAVPLDASLVLTDDGAGPAFLVYDNYRVFLRWNRSSHFALTVGTLADRLVQG